MRTVGTIRTASVAAMLTVALAMTISVTASSAEPITVTFTAYPATADPVNADPSTGTFTFDSSLIPAGGGLLSDPSGLATAVSFFWGSTHFDITTADLIELRFDASGALEFWHLGGRVMGLAAWRAQPASLVVDDFSISPGGTGHSFFYTLAGHVGTFQGGVNTATPAPAPVPEPSTMLLIGTGVLVLLRRRRSGSGFEGGRDRGCV